jgi:nicotinamide phosphoribosyltransferase
MTYRKEINTVELTDSYKVSHWRQYPHGTTRVFSFFESRGGAFPETTFFGLQYYLKRYLQASVIGLHDINEAAEDFAAHFGDATLFNRSGFERIVTEHGGALPILIRAVPEGLSVPTGNVLMTIENTDPHLPWVTNYVETLLSMLWYPTTIATQSRAMRALVLRYLTETGDPSLIPFKVHDFGFRGSTSVESAGIGGAAHLISFMGTDTLQATRVARKYYEEPMAGFSVPAAEHSTITSWGQKRERDAYKNMLEQFPTGLVAVVSDSYDIYHAVKELWGKELKADVLEREGTLVVRPDSGNPPDVVLKVLTLLGESFGYSVNEKGYRVLHPHVRVIQGDGIDYTMIGVILERMKREGWSADNIAFGSGGGLLQKVNRDTQKFAIKCSSIDINGRNHDVIKDPVTDPGKRSKAGRLALVKNGSSFKTVREEEAREQGLENLLVPVFKNGDILSETSFAQVRERALEGL